MHLVRSMSQNCVLPLAFLSEYMYVHVGGCIAGSMAPMGVNDMHAMYVGSKIVYMYVYVQLYASLLLLYLKYH